MAGIIIFVIFELKVIYKTFLERRNTECENEKKQLHNYLISLEMHVCCNFIVNLLIFFSLVRPFISIPFLTSKL